MKILTPKNAKTYFKNISLCALIVFCISGCEKEDEYSSSYLYEGTASCRVMNEDGLQRIIKDETPCMHQSEEAARVELFKGIKYLMYRGEYMIDYVQYNIQKCSR